VQGQTQGQAPQDEQLIVTPEARFLYSNGTQWYPQGVVSDYATARMRLTVPAEYQVVATGHPLSTSVTPATGSAAGQGATRTTVFVADRPVRYLSCLISKFQPVGHVVADVPMVASGPGDAAAPVAVNVDVMATSKMVTRNRQTPARAAAMVQFYAKTI